MTDAAHTGERARVRIEQLAQPAGVREELAREKDLFVDMIGSPVVEAALRKFVESTDVRPYLP